jgi:hypothetical protein
VTNPAAPADGAAADSRIGLTNTCTGESNQGLCRRMGYEVPEIAWQPKPLMHIRLFRTGAEMGESAAQDAAAVLSETTAREGQVRIIAATDASQLPPVERLRPMPGIDAGRVEMFHLDEYIGLPSRHPASFRKSCSHA